MIQLGFMQSSSMECHPCSLWIESWSQRSQRNAALLIIWRKQILSCKISQKNICPRKSLHCCGCASCSNSSASTMLLRQARSWDVLANNFEKALKIMTNTPWAGQNNQAWMPPRHLPKDQQSHPAKMCESTLAQSFAATQLGTTFSRRAQNPRLNCSG